jgi:phosphotransferase system enzyme I (PtsP)
LQLVRHIAAADRRSPGRIAFCGEMAGRTLEAMALVGLGMTSLSMQAANVGPVKQMIRALDTRPLRPLLDTLCGALDPSVRKPLAEFAAAAGVPIERPG